VACITVLYNEPEVSEANVAEVVLETAGPGFALEAESVEGLDLAFRGRKTPLLPQAWSRTRRQVDQSALAGESLLAERKSGDAVFSGSVIRAVRLGVCSGMVPLE
jgi:hypothetical protein